MAEKLISVSVINGKVICGKDGGNVRLRKRHHDEAVWSLDTANSTGLPSGSYLIVDVMPLVEEDEPTPTGNAFRKISRGGGRAHLPASAVEPGIYKYTVTVMPAGYAVDPIIIVEQ